MAEVFQCPSCSGRLQYDGGEHPTVRCDYCGSTVIVPESLRGHKQGMSTLYGQRNAVQEVVRLINEVRHDEAAQLFGKSFGVNQTQAQAQVRLS